MHKNNKLMDELSKLNEKNKEIEHQLKEKQNLIEEYEYEIKILKEKDRDKDKGKEVDSNENKKLIEENKRLQTEREKLIRIQKSEGPITNGNPKEQFEQK